MRPIAIASALLISLNPLSAIASDKRIVLSNSFKTCEYVAIYREGANDIVFVRRYPKGEKPSDYSTITLEAIANLAKEQNANNKPIQFIPETKNIYFQLNGVPGRSGCPEGIGWKSLNGILQKLWENQIFPTGI
jgi:hypothetical protein